MTILHKAPILLLLIIGISYTSAVDYKEIPPSKYSQYPLIPTLRTTGINAVLNSALASGKIKNTQFSLATTNHIYLNISGSYQYYKYNLTLKNAAGDQLSTVFEVRYDNKTKKQLITAMSYGLKYAPTTPSGNPGSGDYVLIPSAQYNSTLIQNLTNFGKDYIVSEAVTKGKLPSGQYVVTLINSVKQQVKTNVTNYRFDVVFAKSDGSRKVNATYDIAYTKATGKMVVIAHNYQVLPYTAPTTPDGNSGSGDYVLIPSDQYNSTLIQNLTNFGKDYIVGEAVTAGKLPSGQYAVTLINSVEQQVGQNVTNYRFDVVFEKSDGSREVEATYDIAYTVGTGKMVVNAHNYQVLPYSV